MYSVHRASRSLAIKMKFLVKLLYFLQRGMMCRLNAAVFFRSSALLSSEQRPRSNSEQVCRTTASKAHVHWPRLPRLRRTCFAPPQTSEPTEHTPTNMKPAMESPHRRTDWVDIQPKDLPRGQPPMVPPFSSPT